MTTSLLCGNRSYCVFSVFLLRKATTVITMPTSKPKVCWGNDLHSQHFHCLFEIAPSRPARVGRRVLATDSTLLLLIIINSVCLAYRLTVFVNVWILLSTAPRRLSTLGPHLPPPTLLQIALHPIQMGQTHDGHHALEIVQRVNARRHEGVSFRQHDLNQCRCHLI